MIYAAEARRHIEALRDHYERLGRPEATRRLSEALLFAERRIETFPEAGLPYPRPYPALARPGRNWIKAGRYWIAYDTAGPTILAVFYETADIPSRI